MTAFSWPTRVYWEDTDAGGIVYYANYLKFLERSRTEWLRALGYSQFELAQEAGVAFAVVNVNIDYKHPARLDDLLAVTCQPRAQGGTSVLFEQSIRGAQDPEKIYATAEVCVVCLDTKTFRPKRLPEFLTTALKTAPGADPA